MIECWLCDGDGCNDCEDGYKPIRECPRQFVGYKVTEAVNIAALCGKGTFPEAGGLLDQSAWFISLYQSLTAEQNKIEREQQERINGT